MAGMLRMVMPQWQGGNNPVYSLGARLLAWLAPAADADTVSVEVPVEPFDGMALPVEDGIVARAVLLRQLRSAVKIIEAYAPDRIVVFGGDCLVSQAPIDYLNERYPESLGVLWIDAHPDVSTPEMFHHEHAMVLGNLLGEGDPKFAAEVKKPLRSRQVMYAGLQKSSPSEEGIIDRLGIRRVGPQVLAKDNAQVVKWIRENKIKHVAIHCDLDVLDPRQFRSVLFASPEPMSVDAPCGAMSFAQLSRLVRDVATEAEVVGMSFAEHLPWDAENLRNFMAALPVW